MLFKPRFIIKVIKMHRSISASRVLLVVVVTLGVIGAAFWYSDYRRFQDPRELVVGSARASASQISKHVTGEPTAAKSEEQQTVPVVEQISSTPSVRDAQQLIERGEPVAAAALLEEILKNHPDDVQALMELAMIHILDLKNNDRARQLLEQIVKLDGAHRPALNELINIYSDPARLDQGLQFLQAQMDGAADASELHYAYGRLLAMSGRTDEAITHFDQAKGLKDIQDQVYVDAAQAAIQSGNYERAFENYRSALRLQEEELARARDQGIDSAVFIEDRIFSTKIEWARMLLRTGRVAQARGILDGISGHDEDPNMVSLRTELLTSSNSIPM